MRSPLFLLLAPALALTGCQTASPPTVRPERAALRAPAPRAPGQTSAFVPDRAKPLLILLDLRGAGVDQDALAVLSQRLWYELFRSGNYLMVSLNDTHRLLADRGVVLDDPYRQPIPMQSLGVALTADYLVFGHVGHIGDTYTLDTQMLDVAADHIVGVAEATARGDLESLIRQLPAVARSLLPGHPAGSSQVAALPSHREETAPTPRERPHTEPAQETRSQPPQQTHAPTPPAPEPVVAAAPPTPPPAPTPARLETPRSEAPAHSPTETLSPVQIASAPPPPPPPPSSRNSVAGPLTETAPPPAPPAHEVPAPAPPVVATPAEAPSRATSPPAAETVSNQTPAPTPDSSLRPMVVEAPEPAPAVEVASAAPPPTPPAETPSSSRNSVAGPPAAALDQQLAEARQRVTDEIAHAAAPSSNQPPNPQEAQRLKNQAGAYPIDSPERTDRLDQALALDPQNAEILALSARAYLAQGNYEQALDRCRRALQVEPDNSVIYTVLGCVHQYRGEFPEAVAAQQRALALDPENYFAQYNLALSLWELDRTRAREAFERYISMAEDNPDQRSFVDQARSYLEMAN